LSRRSGHAQSHGGRNALALRAGSSVATGASREIGGSVLRRPADGFESFGVIPKELESHDRP
jgi:hypothetical protein